LKLVENSDIAIDPFTLNFSKDAKYLAFRFEKSQKHYLVSFDTFEKFIAKIADEKKEIEDGGNNERI